MHVTCVQEQDIDAQGRPRMMAVIITVWCLIKRSTKQARMPPACDAQQLLLFIRACMMWDCCCQPHVQAHLSLTAARLVIGVECATLLRLETGRGAP